MALPAERPTQDARSGAPDTAVWRDVAAPTVVMAMDVVTVPAAVTTRAAESLAGVIADIDGWPEPDDEAAASTLPGRISGDVIRWIIEVDRPAGSGDPEAISRHVALLVRR